MILLISDDTLRTEETKTLFTKQKSFMCRACFTVPQSPKGVSKPAILKHAIKSCTDGLNMNMLGTVIKSKYIQTAAFS